MTITFLLTTVVVFTTVAGENSYIILSPTTFRPGIPLNISVNILKSNAPVTVTASLALNSSGTIEEKASNSDIFNQGIPGTLLLPIPDGLDYGTYLLQVQGSGQGLNFKNETYVYFRSKGISIFIQTDKAKYKPGQTVNFQAFATYPNLTVFTGQMDIDIYDPNGNKIKQWRGIKNTSLISSFMLMDTQPVLGNWRIKVTCKNQVKSKYFEVAHYVLPKFKVSVELPPFILTSDTTLSGSVKATYTYGKPVKGRVHLRAKFDYWYGPYGYYGVIPMVTRTFDINGEANFDIPLDHISLILRNLDSRSLLVEANVTEEINDITLGSSGWVQFHDQAVNVEFFRSNPSNFKPGLPYTAYLKVAQHDGTHITGKRQDINLKTLIAYELPEVDPTPYAWYFTPRNYYDLPDQVLNVPESGIVVINITAPLNATEITFTASYGSDTTSLHLTRTRSPSNSYMQLVLKSKNITAGETVSFDILATEKITVAFYQVLSRGTVVAAGKIYGNTFSVVTTPEMAPTARIIAYYVRTDGEIVTDSIGFDVDGVFLNKVSVGFDKSKAQPHENVSVQVSADPYSVVHLLAVDQSVLLLKSGNDITPSQVVSELQSYDNVYTNTYDLYFPTYYGGTDAYQIFGNAGVHVMTDASLFRSDSYQGGNLFGGLSGGQIPTAMPMLSPFSSAKEQLQSVGRVRSDFPETWLWSSTLVGSNGQVSINTTVPDTITSWIASAFAINSKTGLGVAPSTAKIETFRPFFVSLNLPYSVVRGEQLALQANVFNYMAQNLDVVVTLEQSACFQSITVDSHGYEQYVSQLQSDTIHVSAGEVRSVFFPIVPSCIGKFGITVKAQSTLAADAVRRQLLVEPEGIPKELGNPVLIDLKNMSKFSQDVPISLPAGTVNGSERVVVTTIGDVLGPSMHNLHQLLRMPVGCGEQVMSAFAPDIFVSDYLSATNQLSSDIKDKALVFMEKGYQRELSYQHYDGSFSAFGHRDVNGSMWLTAFVVKSFHQARSYIYIDGYTLEKAITWIIQNQADDGRFPEPGHVHSTYLQGGAQNGAGLTAFVLISLLENNDHDAIIQHRINVAVAKAQAYLERQVSSMTDDYVLAITSYALKLANSSFFDVAFNKLNSHAILKEGYKHWHRNQTQTSSRYWGAWQKQADPIDIETTSYALLTYALTRDYTAAMPIMKWLTKQRNTYGGFASTQDTVIGLQALSEFAAKVYSPNTDIQATVTSDSFSVAQIVNQSNALVLQSIAWPNVPNKITVSATGHGSALVDISLFFHVEQELEQPSFDIQVSIINETIDRLSIQTCAKWLKTKQSGMAVQEFGIPTGFEADLESIAGFTEIKRTETENRKVVLYFDSISTTPLCLTLDVYRTWLVAKSQPAAIRLFDYYQPRNQVTKFYQSNVLEKSGICVVCPNCGCPVSTRN